MENGFNAGFHGFWWFYISLRRLGVGGFIGLSMTTMAGRMMLLVVTFVRKNWMKLIKEMMCMSTKEAYKRKMEAELELAHAKLAQLKARAKISSADAAIKFNKTIDDLEKNVDTTKSRLKELDEAGDVVWEHFKDGADHAWNALKKSVKNATAKFKD